MFNKEEDDEDYEFECSICGMDVGGEPSLYFEEEDSENEIEICKQCLKQILGHIVEKPVEKIIYKTIDKNGNEVGNASGDYRTKFD
jgi:hypothetical protein